MLIVYRRLLTIPRFIHARVGGRTRGIAKILVVEDLEMNRDMLSRRLQRRGYAVVIAVDGEQGVALAQSEAAVLTHMDMRLPVLDGWEATRRLKAAVDHAVAEPRMSADGL